MIIWWSLEENLFFFSFSGKNSFVVRGFKMNLLEKYSTKVLLKGTQVKLQYQLFDSVIIIETGPLVNLSILP